MKIDKKTLIQLIVLFALLIGAGYYFLYYSPANARIESLGEEKTAKEMELQEKQLRIVGEKQLDEDIIAAKEHLEDLSDKIFVDLKLEEALKIMGKLNKDGKIVFDTVNMNESYDGDMQSAEIQQQVNFTADYYDVMEYLRAVRKYDKRIAISSGSFSLVEYDDFDDVTENEALDAEEGDGTDADGAAVDNKPEREKTYKLMVNMVMHYRSLPMLAQLGKRDEQMISDIRSTRELAKGPFNKYADYLAAVKREVQANTVPSYTLPIIATTTTTTTEIATEEIDYTAYNPRSEVNGFEDGAFFFVGSDSDIKGNLTRSLIRKSGGYAADLSFDFITAKMFNSASVVFENEQRLTVQPARIYMQVYAFEASNHSIGIVLLDSAGREYRVTLTDGVNWVEWEEVSASLPEGITYPCVIQRIFVEGIGYDQKVTGRYLFDQLEVDYPQPSMEY